MNIRRQKRKRKGTLTMKLWRPIMKIRGKKARPKNVLGVRYGSKEQRHALT
jgi:hypothetical protein